MKVPILAELFAEGKQPEILFWVGCSGSFDQRAQKITKAFVTILDKIKVNYAILGKEEMCNGDPVRRAGNEFMFQMMAYQNIQTLNNYGIKKIVTACPHCFNILKNEYPALGGNYEVVHHTVFLQELIDEGKIKMKGNERINEERTKEAIGTGAEIIASNCPFCMTMLSDGVKLNEKEDEVKVIDLAELIAE